LVVEPKRSRVVPHTLPIDLELTLGTLVRSSRDPTTRHDEHGWWRSLRTPLGPATLRLWRAGGEVHAEAWGSGADWALESAPSLVGARDSLAGFSPRGLVAELHRRIPGLRVCRAETVFQCSILPVLEQKVTGAEAKHSYHALLRALGEPAPGPVRLLLPPAPEALAALPSFELRRLGIDSRRGAALQTLARRARSLERLTQRDPVTARRWLESLPGIGPWTSAHIARTALGDADALPLGDYNLPRRVAFNLAGEREADDARMLELLAPFAGHRARVVLLLQAGGHSVPRRGPRRPLRRHARVR